jgi:hypothetical protein
LCSHTLNQALTHALTHAHQRQFCICLCFAPAERENHGQEDHNTAAKIEGYRSKFKPIGAAYISGLVVKKMELADGSAISTASAPEDVIGVTDELIMPFDTMAVPVSQFEFSDEEIDDKFDGNKDHIPKGYVSSTTKNDIRIKFEGERYPCFCIPKAMVWTVCAAPAVPGGGRVALRPHPHRRAHGECH